MTDLQRSFNSNAISEESPSYFKVGYVEICRSIAHPNGKKIFHQPTSANILSPRPDKRNQSSERINIPLDQDLDSLKLSVQPDITKGYKNTLRYQSNHHKSFFEKVESSGFKRLSTEITSLYKMPKILRTLKAESTSRTKAKSINQYRSSNRPPEKLSELSYLLELQTSKAKKKTLPKIVRDAKGVDEIEAFEKKLKEESFTKVKNMYQMFDYKKN